MATRALAAAVAGRRVTAHAGLAVLSSGSCCRRGGAVQSFSHSTAERELEGHADADADATAATAAQVEAALNCKNVEVVQGDHSATLVAADAAEALGGVGDGASGADDAWVPDQETGVFVPAYEASGDGNGNGNGHTVSASPSVLDQAVFVREEDMEDVERPAMGTVDVADAGTGAK
ncbi:unnamed protein product [Miscanthus lutarioriparius]|uniref:Uncharacterized protein n=1 Tax=Miscanthus lutarioriparius TaxID=422564 RepID=A0A811SB20_9POAL|nr:unnamed protein product [Miscanthus lutarioriparius]